MSNEIEVGKIVTVRGAVEARHGRLVIMSDPVVVETTPPTPTMETFDDIRTTITALVEREAENREAIDTLRADPLADMEREANGRRIKDLEERVATMEASHTDSMVGQNEKIESLAVWSDKIDAAMEYHWQRMNGIDDRVRKNKDLEERIDNLLESVRLNSTRIDSQGARLVAQNIRTNHHDHQIDQIDKRIDEHGHMIEQNTRNIASVKAFTGA